MMMISKTKYDDRLTDYDAESEYFEDDENEADRFTDDYHEDFKD